MKYASEPNFLAAASVHANIINGGEMPRFDEEFSAAVRDRFPGVSFKLEMRLHDNSVLNAAGDRIRVALRVMEALA